MKRWLESLEDYARVTAWLENAHDSDERRVLHNRQYVIRRKMSRYQEQLEQDTFKKPYSYD